MPSVGVPLDVGWGVPDEVGVCEGCGVPDCVGEVGAVLVVVGVVLEVWLGFGVGLDGLEPVFIRANAPTTPAITMMTMTTMASSILRENLELEAGGGGGGGIFIWRVILLFIFIFSLFDAFFG